jgi:hypothetical protein
MSIEWSLHKCDGTMHSDFNLEAFTMGIIRSSLSDILNFLRRYWAALLF